MVRIRAAFSADWGYPLGARPEEYNPGILDSWFFRGLCRMMQGVMEKPLDSRAFSEMWSLQTPEPCKLAVVGVGVLGT